MKVWDVNMENKPVKTVPLHDYLRPMLYDLFTSDIIFDKFEVCCSPDGKKFASGSYRSMLNSYDFSLVILTVLIALFTATS